MANLSLYRGPVRGTWRGAPLMGTPRNISRKASEMVNQVP